MQKKRTNVGGTNCNKGNMGGRKGKKKSLRQLLASTCGGQVMFTEQMQNITKRGKI